MRWSDSEEQTVELTVKVYYPIDGMHRLHIGSIRWEKLAPIQSFAEQMCSDHEPTDSSYVARPTKTLVGSSRGTVEGGYVFIHGDDLQEEITLLWDAAKDGYSGEDPISLAVTINVLG